MARWTDEQRTQLRDLVESGLTSNAIAREMPFSRSAIMGQITRMKLTLWRTRAVGRVKALVERKQRQSTKLIDLIKEHAEEHGEPVLQILPLFIVPKPKRVRPTLNKCSLMELTYGVCRYPLWEAGTPFEGQYYCGAACGEGPYCTTHHNITRYIRIREPDASFKSRSRPANSPKSMAA